MGNAEAKNRLFRSISDNDPESAKQIIQKFPAILNEPISDDKKTTAVTRAAYINRPHIIACLAELGADLNRPGTSDISALMWAAARGNLDCLNVLLEFNANPDQVGPEDMNAADFAVLYGRYESAWLLKERGHKHTKCVEEFQAIRERKQTLWVDFPGLLISLQCEIPPEVVPPFTVPPVDRTPPLKDPVNDPDESWKDWFHRVLEFQEPPQVERDSLPPERQPQNRLTGKFKILVGMERRPQTAPQPSRPQVAPLENEPQVADPSPASKNPDSEHSEAPIA